jgi:hypothetical protein
VTLLPSLVRRFDRAERGDLELRDSSMRLLARRRRRRTVPGRRPVAPPSSVLPPPVVTEVAGPEVLEPVEREALIVDALAQRDAERAEARAALAGERTAESQRRARRRRDAGRRDPEWERRWRRRRRQCVLAALTLLVLAQGAAGALVGPGFWTGLGVSTLLLVAYVLHLRGIAAAERRRRERLRLRRRRARILARDAAIAAGVAAEVEAMVAEWLAMPRQARREPPEEVVAVLAASGQEVVRAPDGTWYPREIPLPLYVTAPRAPAPAVPAAAPPPAPAATAAVVPPVADDGEEDLPRAVNL